MAEFHIRSAEERDAGAIADVHMSARREAMPYLPEIHSDTDTRLWVAEIVLPNQVVWVAEADGEVIGVAALDGATLEQLYVRPGHQGRGVGTALLAKAIELSPGPLNLWTFQRNTAARAFYERRGFTAVELTDGSSNEESEPDVRYAWAGPSR